MLVFAFRNTIVRYSIDAIRTHKTEGKQSPAVHSLSLEHDSEVICANMNTEQGHADYVCSIRSFGHPWRVMDTRVSIA